MKKQLLNPGIIIVLFLIMSFQTQGPKTEPAKIPPFTFGNDFVNQNLLSVTTSGSNKSGIEQYLIYNRGLKALSFVSWNTSQYRAIIPEKETPVLSGNIFQTFPLNDKVTFQLYQG
jgi:hypothetical protein